MNTPASLGGGRRAQTLRLRSREAVTTSLPTPEEDGGDSMQQLSSPRCPESTDTPRPAGEIKDRKSVCVRAVME